MHRSGERGTANAKAFFPAMRKKLGLFWGTERRPMWLVNRGEEIRFKRGQSNGLVWRSLSVVSITV